MKRLLLSFLLFLTLVPLAWSSTPLEMNTRKGSGPQMPERYVPPVLGNGSLWLAVDWNGSQPQSRYSGVFRSGRRYGDPKYDLLTLGWFLQGVEIDGKEFLAADEWTQTLDVQNGCMRCTHQFPGVKQEMTFLAPLDESILVIRRELTNTSGKPLRVTPFLRYFMGLAADKNHLPGRLIGNWETRENGAQAVFDYNFYGHPTQQGNVVLLGDPGTVCIYEPDGSEALPPWKKWERKTDARMEKPLELAPGETKEAVFYVVFKDTLDEVKYDELTKKTIQRIQTEGFAGLYAKNAADWKAYYEESAVSVPDPMIQRMYETAQYHVRVDATPWSFPVGISPFLWNGRFFGWDEMFIHQGALTSNHLAIARRCPEFRHSVLPKATYRVAHYGQKGTYGAKFVWESLEDGTEGAPPGFWNDHIFHMSNIARSAWTQYLYSNDREFLKTTAYPLILECARYFLSHWTYEDSDGSMYLGKLTDLERLGPARDHAFMTTCGAVYSMRAAADAADLLGVDAEEAANFRRVADKLVESLPVEDGVYIGYRGCKEPTVATLSGIYPYDIFDGDHELQKKTAYKFLFEGRSHANMYPVGNSVCPWYAGKMAITMTVFGDRKFPAKLMREAAETCGAFGELFEINEKDVMRNPWFTTAAGTCVQAVNQMLIFSRGNEIRLFYGVPEEWKDFSFTLPAYGGVQVHAEVKDGKLAVLEAKQNPCAAPMDPNAPRVIVIPKSFGTEAEIAEKALPEGFSIRNLE